MADLAHTLMYSVNSSGTIYLLDTADGSVDTTQAQTDFARTLDSTGNFYATSSESASPLTKYAPDFTPIWTTAFDCATVVVDENDRIFTGSFSTASSPLYVRRINPATGAALWSTDVYDPILTAQSIEAIYATTGRVLVQRRLNVNGVRDAISLNVNGDVTGVEGVGSGGFVILGADGHIYQWDPTEASGVLSRKTAPTWEQTLEGVTTVFSMAYDPISDALYAAVGQDELRRYAASDGSQVWSVSLENCRQVGIDAAGNVYASFFDSGSEVAKIRRFNPANGATVWTSAAVGQDVTGALVSAFKPLGVGEAFFWQNFRRCVEI